MRYCKHGFLSLYLAVATVTARADEVVAARALIEKAILAQGGEAKLSKYPVITTKFKGIFHGFGKTPVFMFNGQMTTHGADQLKLVINSETYGKFRSGCVLNGNRGWVECNGVTQEVNKEKLALMKEEAYAGWVATLLPLKDKAFNLTPIGEVNIDKRPALGVRVMRKSHPDVKLFFDKETALLVKTERIAKDEDGHEMTEEMFLSDYKVVQEIKQPMKFTIKRGGRQYQTWEVTSYRVAAVADDSTFDKP